MATQTVLASAPVIAATATAIAGVWALRRIAHRAILRGLRAPRLAHAQTPTDPRVASHHVQDARIAGARGKQLFAWLVSPPDTLPGPAPAVVVMHGWGSNASMMWQVVPPLHEAGFAHPREVMRAFMAEKRVPYPLVGWYLMRHVQRVIGKGFDDIAPVNTIGRVQCPVLVVHGRMDTVVPVGDAARLVARSPRARLLQVDGEHDMRVELTPHAATIVNFLREACAADTPLSDEPSEIAPPSARAKGRSAARSIAAASGQ